MRPIKLKMSAFGAYVKPVKLDFIKGLRGKNFFLIHGATGSGKTTILDAICYALYGDTSGGRRTGKMMRSEQATANDKTEIEFEFELRGKIYLIKRNPAYLRPKKHGEGMTEQQATAEIFENGTKLEAKDVSEFVKNLLGFDKEQFRQVVVLPQGAFQKFLLASSKDKQEVLNMLFNAEFFKRVEEELKNRASAAKISFENLDRDKKSLLNEVVDENTDLKSLIKNYSDELDAAQEKFKTLEAQAQTTQKNLSDGENLAKLFKDFKIKSETLDDAEKLFKKISGELHAAQIEFDERTAKESVREYLKILSAKLADKKISMQKRDLKQSELKKALVAAEKSKVAVDELTKKKKSCEVTMAQIKSDVEKLQDVPAKLKVAEQNLKAAKEREKLLEEIKNLRGDISLAEKVSIAAKKSCEDAEKFLSELRQAQNSGRAALLAENLIEGEPCPVCGAIHHPNIATSTEKIPTDAQIKAAETKLKTLTDKKTVAENNLVGLQRELKLNEKILADGGEVMMIAAAQEIFNKLLADVKALEKLRIRIKTGEGITKETDDKLAAAQEENKEISGEVERLRGEFDNMTQEIDKKYLSNPKLLDEEIISTNKRLNELNFAFKAAQDNFNRLKNRLSAQKSTVEAAQKNKSEVAAQIEGKTPPDITALKKIHDDAQSEFKSAIETKTKLFERLTRLKDVSNKISALNDSLKVAERDFLMWKTLSEAASGKTSRISFQRYYLSTMFKEVIEEANNRLEKMSGGRYRFQNKTTVTDGRTRNAGLDLEILDDYSGTARPVETLSGGESFLASLSLALGLAAVVQNNSGGIKLDTIFIDEGFGTLDSETLDFALKTLIELQSGGRLVGIISHVEELKNQIPVRLEVFKTKTGSSAKFIG